MKLETDAWCHSCVVTGTISLGARRLRVRESLPNGIAQLVQQLEHLLVKQCFWLHAVGETSVSTQGTVSSILVNCLTRNAQGGSSKTHMWL